MIHRWPLDFWDEPARVSQFFIDSPFMMARTSRQSPHFADCPIAGAALRVLHVWAAASYHHSLKPSVAFATESPELPFTPELRCLGFIC